MSQPILTANPSAALPFGGALITGASRGLGRALALHLAARGVPVALVARDAAHLDAVAREIRAAGGVALAIPEDMADKSAPHRVAQAAAGLGAPVDLVVHAASTLGPLPMPLLADTACEDLAAVLETNLIGPFRLTKILLGSMLLRGRGVVVNVSSDAAVAAYPGWGAYGVSKAALDQLSAIWAEEVRGRGVRFVAIDPGEMNTDMHRDAMPDADPASLLDPSVVAARVVAIAARPSLPARVVAAEAAEVAS